MTLLRWFLPAPLLSAALAAMWLALARSVSVGQIVFAVILGVLIPQLTPQLRLTGVRIRRPLLIARYILMVGGDVITSSFSVAIGSLGFGWRPEQARFVVIPLDLRDPAALAALAMVTTVVPGTVWSELALDRSALLLHVWKVEDEASFAAFFKERYERPLTEIFQ